MQPGTLATFARNRSRVVRNNQPFNAADDDRVWIASQDQPIFIIALFGEDVVQHALVLQGEQLGWVFTDNLQEFT